MTPMQSHQAFVHPNGPMVCVPSSFMVSAACFVMDTAESELTGWLHMAKAAIPA